MVSEGADAPSGFPFTISYQKDVQEGLFTPQKLCFCGDPVFAPLT